MKAFIPSSISRTLYAIPIGLFGIFHFVGANDMVGMVPDFMPAPLFFIYLVGAALIAAAISIIWGKMARTASYLLGIMLVIFVLTIYIPGLGDPDNQMAMPLLLKEIALAAAAFFIGNHMED